MMSKFFQLLFFSKYILQNYEKFDQPFYVEWKNEILIKLQNHFNNKDNQEATSFYKTFHNLVVQQVGKLSKEKKFNIKEDDKILFTCHLRDELVSNNILNGHIIKIWSENQINKIDEMLNTTKAFFDVKALTKYLISIKLIPDPDLIKPITEEDKLKLKTAKYASCWFNILKILIKNQFYSTGDVTHSEYSYLNQLFGTVKAHSTSKSTNKDDIELIKSDPRINEVMLHIWKQLQVICFNNNEGLEFNTTEIDNINIGFKRDPQFLLKRVTQFTEEFFELTHK